MAEQISPLCLRVPLYSSNVKHLSCPNLRSGILSDNTWFSRQHSVYLLLIFFKECLGCEHLKPFPFRIGNAGNLCEDWGLVARKKLMPRVLFPIHYLLQPKQEALGPRTPGATSIGVWMLDEWLPRIAPIDNERDPWHLFGVRWMNLRLKVWWSSGYSAGLHQKDVERIGDLCKGLSNIFDVKIL
jgi:hypothetical protein